MNSETRTNHLNSTMNSERRGINLAPLQMLHVILWILFFCILSPVVEPHDIELRHCPGAMDILGSGFHLSAQLHPCLINNKPLSLLLAYGSMSSTYYMDIYQVRRLYQENKTLVRLPHLVQLWTSEKPDLEAPAALSWPNEWICLFNFTTQRYFFIQP
jgi:hypothetical protein